MTPRALLRAVDRHIHGCLDRDEITELSHVVGIINEPPAVVVPPPPRPESALRELDELFAELVAKADVSGALEPKTEDAHIPGLLAAGLATWIDEQAPTGKVYKHDPLPAAKRRCTPASSRSSTRRPRTRRTGGSGRSAAAAPWPSSAGSRPPARWPGWTPTSRSGGWSLLRNAPWPTGPRTTEIVQAFGAGAASCTR